MMKSMVAFAIALMVSVAFAEECQKVHMGKCSRSRQCCDSYVCWVDGKCDSRRENLHSLEGSEYLNERSGQYEAYDTCTDSLGRLGDSCDLNNKCCFPMECTDGICTADEDFHKVIGVLRSWDEPNYILPDELKD